MANEFLKEMLIGIGFKVDESSYKRQRDLVAGVEKQLVANDKAARERDAAEKARTLAQVQRSAETAAALRMVGAAVAGFATVAATAMAAVALAIKNSIGEFDKLYYAAGRTGASVNNLKALGYAFSQTGSSAAAAMSAVDNFARARRSNPGIDAMLKGYGIDTKGDTSDVLMNSIEAIRKRHPQFAGEQVAGLLGISPDEYDHLIRYRVEIARFTDEYKKLQSAMGVNGGETATAAKEIMRQFGRLSAVVEVFADKVTQAVAPAIEFLATKLGSLVEFLADEDKRQKISAYFDPIIGATKTLVKWVEALYDMFVKVFDYVRNSPFGKLLGAINPGFIRDGIIAGLQPSSAEASEAGGGTGGTTDKRNLWQRIAPKFLGGKDAPDGTGMQARAPGAAGKYRPVYSLTDADMSQRVADIIAGEAIRKNPESIDAVINNMLNRVGSKGWGPSGNLLEVATAPGQYEAAWRGSKANAAETAFIQSRIRAIASGGVPDNTNGSNAYRAGTYRGPWFQKHRDAAVIGGNRFAYEPGAANGPYAPYAEPKADTPPLRSMPRIQMNPGGFDFRDYMNSAPMGSTSSSVDNRRNDMKFGDTNVTIHGNGDPAGTAQAFKRAQSDIDAARLRDFQTAIR